MTEEKKEAPAGGAPKAEAPAAAAPKEAPKGKARRPQALKRNMQSERRRLQNKSFKSKLHTTQRSFEQLLAKGDAPASKEKLSTIFSLMDKGLKTGLFKRNKVNRVKARLQKKVVARA